MVITMNSDTQAILNQETIEEVINLVPPGATIALGNGPGINQIITALSKIRGAIDGVICSRAWSNARLEKNGLMTLNPNETTEIDLYIDFAPQATKSFNLNVSLDKELLQKKYFANVANQFICITEQKGLVARLGEQPVALEVLPFARSHVARYCTILNMRVHWDSEHVSEFGNPIMLLEDLEINEPAKMEMDLERITGVLACSIFSMDPPDIVIVNNEDSAQVMHNHVSRIFKSTKSKCTSGFYGLFH